MNNKFNFYNLNRTQVLGIIFLIQMIVQSIFIPYYFSIYGFFDASRAFVEIGIISLGMTLVIISGGIDLSVGALLALVSVTIGFSYDAGFPMWASMLLGMLAGILGGAFNGVIIAFFRVHPLVVTLGTFALFRGIAFAISKGGAVSKFPEWFGLLGQSYVWGYVPAQLFLFVILSIIFWLILSKTSLGRYIYAIGNNVKTTTFSGVSVGKVQIYIYTLTGFLVGVAGTIHTSRIFTARGNAGFELELACIAAVVLGGARITGGSGTIPGTILGVLILNYLKDGFLFYGLRRDWGLVIIGLVLIIGVFLNEFFRKK